MTRYGLPNKARTSIIDTFTNGGRRLKRIGGRQASKFPHQFLLDHGWVPFVTKDIDTSLEKYGSQIISETEIYNDVVQKELSDYDELRATIISTIDSTTKSYLDSSASKHSASEIAMLDNDNKAILAGDWARFNRRSGSTMTGRVYAETILKPKIDAYFFFIERTIAKGNDLKQAVSLCPNDKLSTFDYTSTWDEDSDYKPPIWPGATMNAWQKLMASIPWNIKVF